MTSVLNAIQAANDATEAAITAAAKTLETARAAVSQCETILEELYNAKVELSETAEKLGFMPVTVQKEVEIRHGFLHGEWNITGEPLPQREPRGIMQ